ncbi:MAG: MFS transporter [Spirochaetales bacterium]|nr:MFS transporter [Spirochaetales bacterium]
MSKAPNKISGSPTQGLFGATTAFFIGLASVALFGPTAKSLAQQLHLNAVSLGFLMGIPALSGALLRIPFGAWVESTGGKLPNLILLGGAFCGITGLALTISHPTFWTLALFGAIAGFGVATFSVSMGQVSYWFSKAKQGTANGIYGGVGNLSPGIASLWIPIALGLYGAQNTYWLWLVYLAVGIGLYAIFGKNSPYFQLIKQGVSAEDAKALARQAGQELFPSSTALQSLKTTARYWQTWVLVVIYHTTFGGFLALTAWFPNYWQTMFGLKLFPEAVGLTAIFSIGASLMRVVGGILSDRLGGVKTAFGSLAILFLGALLMIFGGRDFSVVFTGVCLIAVGMGVNNAATFKILPSVIPSAMGGASGWVGGLGALGGFLFPILQGFFIKNPQVADPGYNFSFLVYALAAVLSVLFLLLLTRKAKA